MGHLFENLLGFVHCHFCFYNQIFGLFNKIFCFFNKNPGFCVCHCKDNYFKNDFLNFQQDFMKRTMSPAKVRMCTERLASFFCFDSPMRCKAETSPSLISMQNFLLTMVLSTSWRGIFSFLILDQLMALPLKMRFLLAIQHESLIIFSSKSSLTSWLAADTAK